MTARTAAQIVERFNEVEPRDPFGWQRESLLDALGYDDAKPWLLPDVTEDQWPGSIEYARATAIGYLPFAVKKALDHRGLSASRTVEHYRGWLWALGLDDEVDWGRYSQYGAPTIAAAALALGVGVPVPDDPSEAAMWERMAAGDPCRVGCQEGCGL